MSRSGWWARACANAGAAAAIAAAAANRPPSRRYGAQRPGQAVPARGRRPPARPNTAAEKARFSAGVRSSYRPRPCGTYPMPPPGLPRRRLAEQPHLRRPEAGSSPSSIRIRVVLPGAVRAEQADHLARADRQVHPVHRGEAPEPRGSPPRTRPAPRSSALPPRPVPRPSPLPCRSRGRGQFAGQDGDGDRVLQVRAGPAAGRLAGLAADPRSASARPAARPAARPSPGGGVSLTRSVAGHGRDDLVRRARRAARCPRPARARGRRVLPRPGSWSRGPPRRRRRLPGRSATTGRPG